MVLKELQEYLVDIIDLSADRHRAAFIKETTKDTLTRNGFQIKSAIACVIDNPPVMESMRNLLKVIIYLIKDKIK